MRTCRTVDLRYVQEFRTIWAGLELRNDRIRAVVPVTFRPLDESLRDCIKSLMAVGGTAVRRRPD